MVFLMPKRPGPVRPLTVIAWPDARRSLNLGRLLRQAGWRVLFADTAAEARRLTMRMRPAALVLAADLPDESGWLACAKLARGRRRTRVIVIDGEAPDRDRFAAFVGAAGRVNPATPVRELADRVLALAPAVV